MDLGEMVSGGVDWILSESEEGQWKALSNAVMNLWFS
jgi:hypothetical protein